MAFDEKIAQLRKSAGMSQEELAQELNISRQAIYKWETGQSLPDIENLKLLAQIFRVSIDSLLNDGSELAQSSALSAAEPQYGEVTRSSLTPADVDAERDNMQKTEKELGEKIKQNAGETKKSIEQGIPSNSKYKADREGMVK